MGEEYGETAPFDYFISHSDPDLIEAVRRGRKEEFISFRWQGEPADPQAEATFLRCKLNRKLRSHGQHGTLYSFYRELIRLRRELPALRSLDKERLEVTGLEQEKVLWWRRWGEGHETTAAFHFGKQEKTVSLLLPKGRWRKELDSADTAWGGPGSTVSLKIFAEEHVSLNLSPESFIVFVRERES